MQGPEFLLLATLAAAATAPAWGQTATPAAATGGSPHNVALPPNFSGTWAHMTWPDFEPPPGGPGPVTNRSRINGVSNAYQLIGDFTNPILMRHAAEVILHS